MDELQIIEEKDHTLYGSEMNENVQHRIDFLKNAINNAEIKVNHIDAMRQRNLNFALLAFAGLFGLGLKYPIKLTIPYLLPSLITVTMVLFGLIDRRLHRLNHGWRETCKERVYALINVINHPKRNIKYPHYYSSGQKKAEKFSMQPVIHYLLCIGGIASYFIF